MLPMTEKISQQVLTLPMYPNMTNEEKNYLIDSIDEFNGIYEILLFISESNVI